MAATYGALACVLTWPLPLYLRTRLLGDPAGDLGVYIWNLWIFRHELIRHGHLPFSTDHIFGATGAADFSLHNFTPVAGVLGAPLIGPFGAVGAFNIVLLACLAMNGIGAFVLARRLALGRLASWWAGALFMASPFLTARETAHFSLVIAAPLPLFLWALWRALELRRVRDAVLVGAFAALATYSDAYYGIYCGLMGTVVVSWRLVRVRWPDTPATWYLAARSLNAALMVLALVTAARIAIGPFVLVAGPLNLSLHTLYTPLLLLVGVAVARAWVHGRPRLVLHDPAGHLPRFVRLGLFAIATCVALMLPQLVGLGLRFANDRLPDTAVFWRSSPRGQDLLAYFIPNPNHAWFGTLTRPWFMPADPDAFPEFIASFSLVAVWLVAFGAWRRVLPGLWVFFTAFFMWLSLGPFVHVAGVNTNVIAPWALLRYVPVIGMARSPARFAVVAALGLSLLAAFAFARLRERGHLRGAWTGALVAAVAAIELVAAPRYLYSAAVPDVYRLVSTRVMADEQGRLLELPTGIRDGTSSLGNFSALTSYFQTSHRRPLVGGYLSRVSQWRKTEQLRAPMLRALVLLSEGRPLSPDEAQEARNARDAFFARTCTRFVLVNKQHASTELHEFAVHSLRLTPISDDPAYALYAPIDPPACHESLPASRITDVTWLWKPSPS